MKMNLVLQLILPLAILFNIATTEGFFFEYPKKVIMDFLQSIKEKKEGKKKPDIHHYHVHYYPIHSSETVVRAPSKNELGNIYKEHLTDLGWSDEEYQYVPEPKIQISTSFSNLWKDALPWDHEVLDTDFFETVKHSENENIYVQIPIQQKVTIEHPAADKKLKSVLLSNLLKKILASKDSIHI